ncbi:hypothetical protein [Leifsonia sp. NPDC058248]|uniref:hypothetical protein n=1 Tax=Leifsonia sp. NPDC058248 TaxID=3346402 RepID=UPI0036DCE48C
MPRSAEPQTLGVALDWVEAHCVVPDGFNRGRDFNLYDYQLDYFSNFYLVRPDVEWNPADPVLGPAFVYRRGLLIGPQKLGKGPTTAAHICLEGVGPALFAGWAGPDDGYACSDHGCGCGWEREYALGEPMGMSWPTPLIQITALSEEQTDNVYGVLRPMIEYGPLTDIIPKTGEQFIRLPGGGRIDTVTSSAMSRLGQRVTFAPQDEVGLWTRTNRMAAVADTQYRGLAGMGGRASLTSNAWNPAEMSVAQQQYESKAQDIYRQFRQPPSNLSYKNKVERRKIHTIVYGEALKSRGGHVDLDAIEAEAFDLIERDPAQAERFFGNRIVAGSDSWLDPLLWDELAAKADEIAPGDAIAIGFDGSLRDDSTALIGCRISDGRLFLLGLWEAPEDEEAAAEWEVPVGEVDAAVAKAFADYSVVRMYCDPAYWQDIVGRWASEHGEKIVTEWWTNRERAMVAANERFHTAATTRELSYEPNDDLSRHVKNAKRKQTRSGVLIRKDRPGSPNKIDAAVAAVLAYEARGDAVQAGALRAKKTKRFGGF